MVTVLDFVTELVTSLIRLVQIFIFDVALSGDPLSFVLWAIGMGLVTVTVGYFGVLVVGALADLIVPEQSGGPQQRA